MSLRPSLHARVSRRHGFSAACSKTRKEGLTAVCLLLAVCVLGASGCSQLESLTKGLSWDKLSFRSQSPDKKDDDDDFGEEGETKLNVPMVGDYTNPTGLHRVVVEGVGLVVGLDGTGDDPPPSQWREMLVDDLTRRNIKGISRLLASSDTTLVVVRAYLPPLVRKGDRFDLEVRIPGETDARSLAGGRLKETVLSETAVVSGRGRMKGNIVGKANGPILIPPSGVREEDQAGLLKRGRILAGGVSYIDRDMALYVKSNLRTYRNITRLSDAIGRRFYDYNEYGIREPLAKAQTDQRVVLRVHPLYQDNYPRYLRLIENIAFRESVVAQRVRMKRLEQDLLVPEKADVAALRLEALGESAIPVLKTGLASVHLECRFHAAQALAYLQEPSGIDALREAAIEEPAFRVFAFAALSVLEDPEANFALRDLMSAQKNSKGKLIDSGETRYGAMRALQTLDPGDPFLGQKKLNHEYFLHVLDTTGEPMVHITLRRRPEITLFGSDLNFSTPLTLRAGHKITITCRSGSDEVTLKRFSIYGEDLTRKVDLSSGIL